ncbi:helix-turn-helix domain-containing protein [Massilioclostridium coli]|uniref:helix-turn-helix domain-containing protein n=1 Tax=Massilioclostridium coli TaxID=1870991 RepID=UPI0022E42BCD|nr:helix-turn-helix domain-containing protein [Massilioclostridium coli]
MAKELSHETILQAIKGEAYAIHQVVDYFHNYIIYLSKIESYTNTGNAFYYYDIDIQRELETHLIATIIKFRSVAEEIK